MRRSPLFVVGLAGLLLLGAAPFAIAQNQTGTGLTVWNHAYQENYDADVVGAILSNAENAYVLLDPFKDDVNTAPAMLVQKLKAKGNQVGAYISIGTGENWRADFADLQPHLVQRQWGEWAGEYFISTPNDAVLNVMKTRIDKIARWGFGWVEFDNMDWAFDDTYRKEYGVKASTDQAMAYYRALCSHVQSKGMKCMAKSTVEGAEMFDGVTYESYVDDMNWWDVEGAKQFLAEGKLVVVVHYNETDCNQRFDEYRAKYGAGVSFTCEDPTREGYVHF